MWGDFLCELLPSQLHPFSLPLAGLDLWAPAILAYYKKDEQMSSV